MRLSDKETARRLKVGDKVVTDFHSENCEILRTVTSIEFTDTTSSGVRVYVDNGEPCPCCGRPYGDSVKDGLDGQWFIPVS